MSDRNASNADVAFRFLHLSDLHAGADGLRQHWPRYKTGFHEDLKRLLDRVGYLDLIVVSGDLANRGSREEYQLFEAIIEEIGSVTVDFGDPKIVTVPGNHDVVRPNLLNPFAKTLQQFDSDGDLQRSIWKEDGSEYIDFLKKIFAPYDEWLQRSIHSGIHLSPNKTGILPGDASYLIQTSAGQIGLVALNSTWLQFGPGDAKGALNVGIEQLLAITDDDPDKWVAGNEASLLITHHPPDWLSRSSLTVWNAEINPAGRFDAHLFGHMHEPITSGLQIGGTARRVSCQAASLFGLERCADNTVKRIQGYAVVSIDRGIGTKKLTVYPRKLISLNSGQFKIDRDNSHDLDEDTGSFSIELGKGESSDRSNNVDLASADLSNNELIDSASRFDISQIHFVSIDNPSHRNVRRLEQETCIHALLSKRIVWISAEWGMGLDGFIGSIRERLSVNARSTYSLDFSSYITRDHFLEEIRARHGFSFQRICEALSEAGKAIFLFDEVDLASSSSETIEFEIEAIAQLVRDFAPDAFVVIRARRRPRNPDFDVVALTELDEVDVGIYANESEGGGGRFKKLDAVAKLLRHTDGVPARIDDALRELEVVSLSDLIASNPDFSETGGQNSLVPPPMAASVAELSRSTEKVEQRAYDLLLALAALPQGEQLSRLKRFLGVHPFGPVHARVLLDRSLLTTVGITRANGENSDGKALVVPKPVRDYVRESLAAEKALSVDLKVLDLYFGPDWSTGDIWNSPIGKRARSAHCDGYEIQNASTLVARNVRRALDIDSSFDIDAGLRLAKAFVGCLDKGDHYRAAASLCDDIIHLMDEFGGSEVEKTRFQYDHGTNLRMCGDVSDAKDVLEGLNDDHLSKSQKQYASLCLALCYERVGTPEETLAEANKALAYDKKSVQGLNARVIIAEQESDEDVRATKLEALLVEAKRRKATTISNNIRLELARSRSNKAPDAEGLLREAYTEAVRSADYYNSTRAIIDFASRPGQISKLTEQDKSRLIQAYHYLYNERLFNLFDKCHLALWRLFEHENDEENLLNLFRRSSFIWRLNGRDDQESHYVNLMKIRFSEIIRRGLVQRGKDRIYFLIRITVVTGAAFSDLTARREIEAE